MGQDARLGGIGGHLAGDGNATVLVLHEWDGLVPHIRDVTDRIAALGFTAFAPDLYDGASAPWGDAAEAERLQQRILRDPRASHRGSPPLQPRRVRAVTLPASGEDPVVGNRDIRCPVLVHVAEHEEHNPPASPAQFPTWFEGMANVELHIYPGTRHAFFNDSYPDCYDAAAAALSWERTTAFLRAHLT
jgi:carboxymethylenebutenolidase